jgi:hypothetical protein
MFISTNDVPKMNLYVSSFLLRILVRSFSHEEATLHNRANHFFLCGEEHILRIYCGADNLFWGRGNLGQT